MSYYNPDYEEYLRDTIPGYGDDSLMITEVYVPRQRIREFSDHIVAEGLSPVSRVFATEAAVRPGRAIPKQLVSPLQSDV